MEAERGETRAAACRTHKDDLRRRHRQMCTSLCPRWPAEAQEEHPALPAAAGTCLKRPEPRCCMEAHAVLVIVGLM